jgi:hypothetical protein
MVETVTLLAAAASAEVLFGAAAVPDIVQPPVLVLTVEPMVRAAVLPQAQPPGGRALLLLNSN